MNEAHVTLHSDTPDQACDQFGKALTFLESVAPGEITRITIQLTVESFNDAAAMPYVPFSDAIKNLMPTETPFIQTAWAAEPAEPIDVSGETIYTLPADVTEEKPKRKRRTKAEMLDAAAAAAAKPVKMRYFEDGQTTDDGSHAKDEDGLFVQEISIGDWHAQFGDKPAEEIVPAEEVTVAAVNETIAAQPQQAEYPAVTKDELIALLNTYSAKHPKKALGARDVMAQFGGTRIGDIPADEWPLLAQQLRVYISQN